MLHCRVLDLKIKGEKMTRNERKQLEELSMKLTGNASFYKKLGTQMVAIDPKDDPVFFDKYAKTACLSKNPVRLMKTRHLSSEQVKEEMIKMIAMMEETKRKNLESINQKNETTEEV